MFIRLSSLSKGLVVFFLISAAVGGSCAPSYMAVPHEPIIIKTTIVPGDEVRVTTKDNRKVEFKVVKVTDEAIIGENETIHFTNISKLEEMTVSAGEQAGRNAAAFAVACG